MNLNFENRIAFYYMVATAIIMAIAFAVIYFVVSAAVYSNLDSDLSYEAVKHTKAIKIIGDSIVFNNKEEWQEREHREVQVNPVFIQLIDKMGQLMDKSPNLKEDELGFREAKFGGHFDSEISNISIRQVQLPIEKDGKIIGYILAAMTSASAKSTLLQLRNVLIITYLLIIIGLYFISRFLAGRSISPVQKVTNTITHITKYNLKERVALPSHHDEIYDLSVSFNSLLDRIENAIERERQFTSDASHELRTPLATLRGTLEVLIRKARNQEEYEEKVKFCLNEIDKMTSTLEQLLLLARLDSKSSTVINPSVALSNIIDESLRRLQKSIADKNISINYEQHKKQLLVPQYYTNLIIENVLNNAIKYSENDATITILTDEIAGNVVCTIQDEGIGIYKADLKNIYDSFFRSEALNHKHISGTGLGLSIVKKCADAIQAHLIIDSEVGVGTKVTIRF